MALALDPYSGVLFLHMSSVLGFFLVHGISIGVVLRLRKEREPERLRALLSLSRTSVGAIHMFTLLVIASGLVLGFMGLSWGQLWFWTAFFLFVGLSVAMHVSGTRYYDQIRRGVGVEPFYQTKRKPASPPPTPKELDALLSSPRSLVLTAVGVGGLLVILWLMMFKPF